MEEFREKYNLPVRRGRFVEVYSEDGLTIRLRGRIWSVYDNMIFLAGYGGFKATGANIVFYDDNGNVILDTRN